MGIERYIAAASMGLFAMFAAEIVVFYNFLQDPHMPIEASPKILQFVSIGVAPACILAAVSYIMSRRYGSRAIGAMICAGGAAMLAGMAYAHTQVGGIAAEHLEFAVVAVPAVFAAVSVPVIVVGASLLRERKRPRRHSSIDHASWTQSDD
ncbi:MAG: hypothetical protein OXU86_04865 [Thaumarchaeota archaeon]|nr:hypothetical protein [Nitrososphaerota archaeon]RNJ73675.1 MAG: hypothetical protein EB833_02305 [Thaumarchaeota archaeon S13]RNJ74018.1 MAG: hypothetical protein EB832_00725 [Thaumarchaeota archaeon S14]RNJ75873.1 MAG: hypothetical protein EB824_01205 [Thaumarchaeota archaeon S15]MDD9809027.1 hypothetical protein [Nitrososphaerota archaeon]